MTEDSKDIIEQDLNKAINFLGQNKFSEAELVCNEILKEKDNSDAYHILSSIKLYKQEFNQSIELVNKSIEIKANRIQKKSTEETIICLNILLESIRKFFTMLYCIKGLEKD